MNKPSGINKIEASLKEASKKGYKVTKVYGVFTSYTKAKKLDNLGYQAQVAHFNEYLNKYNIAVFSSKKGMFYCNLKDYTPSVNQQKLEW